MMVSKVAVVALVAILAVPIMLGYAMNLSEQTRTEYENTGQAIDVTPLLENGEVYTTAKADIYKANTDFSLRPYNTDLPIMPVYESINSVSSTLAQFQESLNVSPGNYMYINWINMTSDFYWQVSDPTDITFIDLEGGVISHTTVNNIKALYYKQSDNLVYCINRNNAITSFTPYDTSDMAFFRNDSSNDVTMYYSGTLANRPGKYVDLSAGFHFENYTNNTYVNFPQKCSNFLMTVNIDSIPDANFKVYYKTISGSTITFEKVTNGGDVKYYFNNSEIYHDPNRSDNTYQIYMSIEYQYTNGNVSQFNIHSEARYVGSWPTFIGQSNYFMKYEFNTGMTVYNATDLNMGFDWVGFYLPNPSSYHARSHTIRIDDATFSAFKVPAIINNTLDPAAFKTNPSTKIGSVTSYGNSITFGGNTYNVGSDGNITIGQRQFSLRNMVFDSLPTSGGYDNRINGYVVSTTANPSTVSFNGIWRAAITVDGMDSTTVTKTEWTVGEFGWDGIDQNFLIVGILAALGVFVALGIAYRKTKAALGALLVVCGGAIVLFFTML